MVVKFYFDDEMLFVVNKVVEEMLDDIVKIKFKESRDIL